MKRVYLLLFASLLIFLGANAAIDARYGKGAVPVVNNRVTFEKTISALNGFDEQQVYEKAVKWVEKRFVKPTVIAAKTVENDPVNHRIVINAEEYIVFKNRFLVLDRSRINYWLEIKAVDNGFTIKMTRINYWYEEERDGGMRFTAEEWITDEQCFNNSGTKFLRSSGKFRTKTIDLFDSLCNEFADKF